MQGMLDCPKQYVEINEKPVIGYCLDTFQLHKKIDGILIVADAEWHESLKEYMCRNEITKFIGFAEPGAARQLSIYNGLQQIREFMTDKDTVLVHDAARPFVTGKLITRCVEIPEGYAGVMPVLPVKDTIYQSQHGKAVTALLDRSTLFSGQTPECFQYGQYFAIHQSLTLEEIAKTHGSSEIAFQHGMKIAMTPGEECNFKLTVPEDFERMKTFLQEKR